MTMALATSTNGRRGTAANVERMEPQPYSLLIMSTPRNGITR